MVWAGGRSFKSYDTNKDDSRAGGDDVDGGRALHGDGGGGRVLGLGLRLRLGHRLQESRPPANCKLVLLHPLAYFSPLRL